LKLDKNNCTKDKNTCALKIDTERSKYNKRRNYSKYKFIQNLKGYQTKWKRGAWVKWWFKFILHW